MRVRLTDVLEGGRRRSRSLVGGQCFRHKFETVWGGNDIHTGRCQIARQWTLWAAQKWEEMKMMQVRCRVYNNKISIWYRSCFSVSLGRNLLPDTHSKVTQLLYGVYLKQDANKYFMKPYEPLLRSRASRLPISQHAWPALYIIRLRYHPVLPFFCFGVANFRDAFAHSIALKLPPTF